VDNVPERALLRAEEVDVFALSAATEAEIAEVLGRPKFERAITRERRVRIMEVLRGTAVWFEPAVRVTDCRDPKDNMYLELALAAGAEIMSAATTTFSCSIPGVACVSCARRTTSPSPDLVAYAHTRIGRMCQLSRLSVGLCLPRKHCRRTREGRARGRCASRAIPWLVSARASEHDGHDPRGLPARAGAPLERRCWAMVCG
jgi:putative PIN family toxin of toxin-antitoxin system